MIDLDHNATTPLDPAVLERMLPFLREHHGNASSVHAGGQRARRAIDEAREQLARALGCRPKELAFTSGGTEADNLAMRGAFSARRERARRIVVSSVEHLAVLDTARSLAREGAEVVEIPVDGRGRLDLDALERAVTPECALVSVMWANNETGVLNPVDRIGALCRERGVPFHVDAVQAFGRVPIDLGRVPVDLLSVSAHKVHGPKGCGALYVRTGAPLWTVQTGGHQERGRRAGTENVAAIAGFGEAAALATERLGETGRIGALRDRLEAAVRAQVPEVRVAGDGEPRLCNTGTLCFRGVTGEGLLMALDLAGVRVSSGSACTAGSLEPSHVLRAMGMADEWARGAVRFSLGRGNTAAEIDAVAARLPRMIAALRGHAA